VGAWDRARDLLSEAATTAERIGDDGGRANASLGLAYIRVHTDSTANHANVRADIDDAIRVFEAVGDKSGIARAHHIAAMLLMWGGQNARAVEEMEVAAQHAREAGDRALEIEALAGLAIGLAFGPEPARTALTRIEEIGRQSGDSRRLKASALRSQAALRAMLGQFDTARELIMTADGIAAEVGLENLRAAGILRIACEIELMAGDASSAERFSRAAHEKLERDKDWGHLASVAPLLAEALLAQAREQEAEALLDQVAAWAIDDDAEAHIFLAGARSRLAALREDPVAAEAFARAAVERAETGDELNAHAGALVRLADALELAQRGDEAAAALRGALRLYERKENVVGAERVRQRLGMH
jgi:hypothetical protein